MTKEVNEKPGWILEIGLYPGILFGIRTYNEGKNTTHVLYLPLIDISVTFLR